VALLTLAGMSAALYLTRHDTEQTAAGAPR
jgi:hypothetical protein